MAHDPASGVATPPRFALWLVLLAAAGTFALTMGTRHSMGQFLMTPIAGALLVGLGWASAMQLLALCILRALAAAFLLQGNALHVSRTGQPVVGTRAAIRLALRERSYLLLGAALVHLPIREAPVRRQAPA